MDQAGTAFLRQFLEKYKHVLLILLVGIALMLLPTSKEKTQSQPTSPSQPTQQAPLSLQEELSELLSRMSGAGKVEVLLTEATGQNTLYQANEDTTSDETAKSSRTDTVILTDSNRNQTGMVCRIDPPTYLGAVVLCQGADNPAVRLAITEAVSNATGLGYHKITILKMK